MMDTLTTLKERRSCRKYLDKQISGEQLDAILEAGTYAPTGMNKQSPIIVAIQDRETINAISKLNGSIWGKDTDPFYGAIVFADTNVPTYIYDGSLVMGNLMNAAYALGVDSCYIFRAKEVFNLPEGKEYLKKWGIPDNYEGIGNCILGYRSDGGVANAAPRKEGYVIRV